MHMPQGDKLLRGTLDLLLFQALADGPLHGYAIARRVEIATGDALRVEEGSMYPALHRLEEGGLVTARWSTTDRGRRVRVYALTRRGRDRLDVRRQEWLAFARAVTRMVKG
jgi:transcriptional regulator